MRILLLIDSLVSGGRERRLIELIKGLKKHADTQLSLVVFSSKIHYQEIYDLDISVTILERVPKRNPLVFYRLYKLCRIWKPDLIHSWGTMSAIWAIPSALLLHIKLINGNITDAPDNMGFFDQRLFRARLTFPFSSVIVGNSKAGLIAYKVPKQKRKCIYNGFDLNRLSHLTDKGVIREYFNIKTPKVVGMVGGFYDRKDYHSYIMAALQLLEQRDDVTFMAVGEGPNLMKCKALVLSQYASRFVFTGIQKDVESIINIFDIGVLTSNTDGHGEGISNAILEYMALEKPVVATSGGGTPEVVRHRETGLLIPNSSPGILADTLVYLLDNPAVAGHMGQEGRKLLSTDFSLDKMTEAYENLYKVHL